MHISTKHLIHQFDLSHEIEVDKTETRTEGEGEAAKTVTVTSKVKEPRRLVFALKRPNREEKFECEMVRDAAFKYFVDRGIITEGNLRKQYGDNGGIYTNEEETYYQTLREKMRNLITEYQGLALDNEEQKARAADIFAEIFDIREKVMTFERTSSLFYERTAEAKSQKKAQEYLFVQLSYTHPELPLDSKDIDWQPYFKGETTEEKLKHLAALEDENDEVYLKMRDRMLLLLTLVLNVPNLTAEQIKAEEKAAGLVE